MRINFALLFLFTALIISGLFVFHLHKTGQLAVSNADPALIETSSRESASESSFAVFVDNEDGLETHVATPVTLSSDLEILDSGAKTGDGNTDWQQGEIKFDIEKKVELENGKSVEYGEFTLDVGLPRNDKVKVH